MTAAPSPEDFSKIDALVGARVRLLRERRKMSQTALGEQVGVSFQQIQKYERGTNRISASCLFQIARALGVAPADLFEGIDTQEPGDPHWSRVTDPQIGALVAGFGRISSPKIRTRVVELIASLAAED